MAKADQTAIVLRVVIEQPVIGVRYSLQAKEDGPLDPKTSREGEALSFDVPVRVAPGPRFFGDQVRREGPVRRFVYIRVGTMAGDADSPWTRRIKIDIHDIEQALLDRAMEAGGVIETAIIGTGADGTPTCATARPVRRLWVKD